MAIGPVVPASSWEGTLQTDVNGNHEHEEIYADFYSTFGQFTGDASLALRRHQRLDRRSQRHRQPVPAADDPGSGFIWIVVHDNRGGASWVTIPVLVQ